MIVCEPGALGSVLLVCYSCVPGTPVYYQRPTLFPILRKSRHSRRRATKKRECDQWLSVGIKIARLEKIPRWVV